MSNSPLILLAAGGTGGHLFPAEALGVELIRRGLRVRLATDARALRYSGLFTPENIDVVPSETVRGRDPVSLARTAFMLGYGTLVAVNLVRRLKPSAVVGFGGYPTVPPLMAAKLLGVSSVIHDANAVLGRANRFLSSRVNAIATSLPGVLDRDPSLASKTTTERAIAPVGRRRQPGRAGDERHRSRCDRAAGAGAVEPPGPDAAGA
jgi:UDP-N-acetylglucosamine--N-acetylmuramyl-(pentapeptide) pyrophosphoryl-undecaprenol N-acetylglucosamine transferase